MAPGDKTCCALGSANASRVGQLPDGLPKDSPTFGIRLHVAGPECCGGTGEAWGGGI